MKLLKYKFQTIPYVLKHISDTINNEHSPFEMLSSAPIWLRLLSRGNYCAYKKHIFVPKIHLELVSSVSEVDRTLATAKLIPWIMFLHDKQQISFLDCIKGLYSLKYQLHYFLYQFLFLKATEHKFFEAITIGFMISRKSWFKKLSYERVEHYLNQILNNNIPKTL